MVGIRGSQVIVAVDSNPDSAMLVQADYGVVMDLYEFVPALIEALRTRGVRPAKAR
jgi:electron transfer flavoprotein alpha subunit